MEPDTRICGPAFGAGRAVGEGRGGPRETRETWLLVLFRRRGVATSPRIRVGRGSEGGCVGAQGGSAAGRGAGGALQELFVLRTLKKKYFLLPHPFCPSLASFLSPLPKRIDSAPPPRDPPRRTPPRGRGKACGQRAWAARGRSVRNSSQLCALPSPSTHSGSLKSRFDPLSSSLPVGQ